MVIILSVILSLIVGVVVGFWITCKFIVPDILKRFEKEGLIAINRSVSGGKL